MDLIHLLTCDVSLICICISPVIDENQGFMLFSNTFFKLIDGLATWFMKIESCNELKSGELAIEPIDSKIDYISNKFEQAVLETHRQIKQLYFPLRMPFINELSGEYYQKIT